MDGSNDIPNLLTVPEVAAIMRIKPKTLRNRMARKNGSAPPSVKDDGGYWVRFERSAVEAWIAQHTDTTTDNQNGSKS